MLSFTLRRAKPRVLAHARFIHPTPPLENAKADTHKAVAEENKDVSSMDTLLRAVSESCLFFVTAVPVRSRGLWSETLLNATSKPAALDEAKELKDDTPLAPRNMHESYSELVLPFGSSSQLLEQYTNASGGIRTGKLMEHLDSLAGSIAYKHMLGPSVKKIQGSGFYIVTASVDRLDMLSPLDPTRDLRLSGQVIYTGHSSMEVAVKMESTGKGLPDETVLIGRFSMVCRNSTTHRARKVNPLILATSEERGLHELGEHMKQRRQSSALKSLSRVPPSSEEAAELHTFYLKHGQGQAEGSDSGLDHVWMGDTVLEKCLLMFPQERNIHQKIFGGYLMRLAYELGFANASMFTRGHVRFLSLDGISFARPVPIGSILRLRSQILYTASSAQYPILVHVGVKANVVDVKTGQEQTTNDFRFTWCQDTETASPDLRKVVPKTYKEAMLWLEGKRAIELGAEIRGLRTK
ncbi:hypothetical protein CVT25_004747 [Psilocybe cyanescens]|uniref:HotDog ACOT-type domain-containing protein n=1 Tax=Psilocybe cyanescens TaxID=93625 RepID=A0A409VSU5_PSICY|nr:hypothetical protein CVT25_004747 [Psilocybe cyanescens]